MADAALPEPLVPAEVDLNGYAFMPLLHHRVLQSTLFVKSTGDEFKAAFALWCASWSELPAGSLPNDEEMLEHFSRSKAWKKVRARALYGWILCSDGRLYHPIIAPLAIDAWERREEFREVKENRETRQDRWRRKVKEMSEELRALGVPPPFNANLKTLEVMLADAKASTSASRVASTRDGDEASTGDACRHLAETALTGTETGTETRQEKEKEKEINLLSQVPARPSADQPQHALKGLSPERQGGPPDCPHQAVLALWAEVLPAMPQHLASQWRGTRADHLRARWRETAVEKGWTDPAQGIAYLRKFFAYIGQSAFLSGRSAARPGSRAFVIELEWLVNPTNWAKVHEGKYHEDAAA